MFLPLRARSVRTLAVLTEIAALRAQYRQVQFRYAVGFHRRMALCKVIYEHTTALEAEQTLMTLVDETMNLSRCYAWHELRLWQFVAWQRDAITQTTRIGWIVHAFYVLL